MNITWYGTASVSLDDGETRLLFDPFLRPNKKLMSITMEDFSGADAVLVTHGHYDHIIDIPEFTNTYPDIPVYCTKTPRLTLAKKGAHLHSLHEIHPGDKFSVGKFNITVYPGRHVTFSPAYIASVFPKCFVTFPKVFYLEYLNVMFPENNEIVIYEIENSGKTVLLMGSFGYRPDVEYPKNPDLFVLAYGGSEAITKIGMPFLNQTRPKTIYFDHYDNSFPPVTKRMKVEKFCSAVCKELPDTKFYIPTEKTPAEI